MSSQDDDLESWFECVRKNSLIELQQRINESPGIKNQVDVHEFCA